MTDLQIHTYGPAWAVTKGRIFIAFAASEQNAEDLVARLAPHPEDHWGDLIPDPFAPCFVTSVRRYEDEGAVVLAGADASGWPVCMPMTQSEWERLRAPPPGAQHAVYVPH